MSFNFLFFNHLKQTLVTFWSNNLLFGTAVWESISHVILLVYCTEPTVSLNMTYFWRHMKFQFTVTVE